MDLDWLSSMMIWTQNPRVMYPMMWLFFMELSFPTEPNLIYLEIVVVKNEIPATFIMSADNGTSLYCCIIGREISVLLTCTAGGCRHTVFPFRFATLGLQINLAFFISCMVIGQLGIILFATYLIRSLVEDLPMRLCKALAFMAWLKS